MNNFYNKDDYCMNFTTEEIEKYLLQPIREKTEVVIKLSTGDKKSFYSGNDKMYFFNGNLESFNISFYGHQTSIFITDETPMPNRKFTFNEVFMFIDDYAKENIVSSDTYGNVVYEGTLRDKNHKDILGLFAEFVTILIGAKNITVEETIISQDGWHYPKCNYIIRLTNTTEIKNSIRYNNILFLINE